jgi:L-iditol 2-dehydrogenase
MKLQDVDLRTPARDEVVVKVMASGICGSDVECYEGRSIEAIFPYTPGHEWSGEVVQVGEGVTTLQLGDRVTAETVERCGVCAPCRDGENAELCLNPKVFGFQTLSPGGFAQFVVRKEAALHKLPQGISFEEGALVEPFAVAYHGVWRTGSGVEATDDVVIFGLGPIGLFALAAAKVADARVICVDPIKMRQDVARRLGADVIIDPTQTDASKQIRELTGGRGADLVVDASGSIDAVGRTVEVAKNGGRIALIGNSYGKTIPMEMWKVIAKGLTIRGSAGAAFPQAIKLIAAKKVDLSPMISHRFPLDGVKDAFDLAAKRVDSVKIIVAPSENGPVRA